MKLTDILGYYYQKFPLLFGYFDFLRDLFLFFQISLIIIFIFSLGKKSNFIYYFLIFILAFLLSGYLKASFPKLRPLSIYFAQDQFIDSFPSRHTTISFALSLALILQNITYGILSLVLTFLIAFLSWLSLQHWPIDILVGFLLGFLVFLVSQSLLYFFHWFYIKNFKKKV